MTRSLLFIRNLSLIATLSKAYELSSIRRCVGVSYRTLMLKTTNGVDYVAGKQNLVCDSLSSPEITCSSVSKPQTSTNMECSEASISPCPGILHTDIQQWSFDENQYLAFPLDPVEENSVRWNVPNAIFSLVNPTPLGGQTALAVVSSGALDCIDMDSKLTHGTLFRDFAAGTWIHPASTPMAHRYGGHQFGWWAEQLGDGRAHLLGHYTNRKKERWELQLKGSGKTPYSRHGDGRAVIRSSVREFLGAEAMAALGFRTSRCASIVIGDEKVIRDQFYNGNIKREKTAVVLRLAPTWFRFGSLEILTRKGEIENLKLLVDFILREHFPDIDHSHPDKYLEFYSVVVGETAEMIAEWQSIGYTHGVMNTDNMSIKSVTIDYGPFGFMEAYDPDFVPNTSDDEGMYSYANQPTVGRNNLQRLGVALQPLLTVDQIAQLDIIVSGYDEIFRKVYLQLFMEKLGCKQVMSGDNNIVHNFLQLMEESNSDFTLTFWELGNITISDLENKKIPSSFWAVKKISKSTSYLRFIKEYKERLVQGNVSEEERQKVMSKRNPRYVLRNWIAQKVIEEAEKGQFYLLGLTLKVLEDPFTLQKEAEDQGFAKLPPKWAGGIRVSCSS
ncbi:protein nucleotidyltransferase YdiU-like [Oratosquilla oratoria]|uniref:protein nucleotidyltransferase YdiU-like n=1 Tax=Oratosquilla oratoria TaxID=337810 RepID=UPI003F761461